MSDPVTQAAPTTGLTMTATAPAAPAPSDQFHALLSELNPLQYLPVVGTLYRSITGDVIPQGVREFGSFIVSGLTGGPIGLATNMALLAVEKATGIDPEAIGQNLLADIGIGHGATPQPATAQATPLTFPTAIGPATTAATAKATADATTAATTAAAATAPAQGSPVAKAVAPAVQTVGWSPAQLSAYGVTKTANGDLRRGSVSGADVLNDLELARHQAATPGV
jgi:hypothetical protein